MSQLVKISELKVGKRLGLSGGFLVFSEPDGYHVLFQSEYSGDKFYIQSQRGSEVRKFKTLDAVKNALEDFDWPMQIFGDFSLKQGVKV